jgi:hypothetical protein
MDDQVSMLECLMFYYTDARSPLLKNHKDFVIYRDLVLLYKIMVADHHPRKSPKLQRWNYSSATPNWSIKGTIFLVFYIFHWIVPLLRITLDAFFLFCLEFDRPKTMCDLNVACFNQPSVSIENKLPYSPADAQVYMVCLQFCFVSFC